MIYLILIYIIIALLSYTIFDNYLVLIDKKTGKIIEINNKSIKILLEIIKVIYSIAWIIFLPLTYIRRVNKEV